MLDMMRHRGGDPWMRRVSEHWGVKLKIIDMTPARVVFGFILRGPKYLVRCLHCDKDFDVPWEASVAKCPRCGYHAKMRILERDYEEQNG